jgi:CBS domain-containing protein
MTVREFLRQFGVERRGAARVEAIRLILDACGLATDPNFETAWIDEPITLILKSNELPSQETLLPADAEGKSEIEEGHEIVPEVPIAGAVEASEQPDEAFIFGETASEPTTKGGSDDPTFRIGSLPAANKNPVSVNVNDSLAKAVTIMLQYDFSQLPVMQGDRDVRGIITWKSISSRLALTANRSESVRDYMESPEIATANTTLFNVISTIAESGYILVRHSDKTIKGPVTISDLSFYLQGLTEPFLRLREIELHVRTLIGNKINADDLASLSKDPIPPRGDRAIADLTFGEYARLLQNPATWTKIQLRVDRGELAKLLEDVRIIRNEVMHFDPDPMTPTQLSTLKRAVRFLQNLYELFP